MGTTECAAGSEVHSIFSPPPPSTTLREWTAAAEKKCCAGKQGRDEKSAGGRQRGRSAPPEIKRLRGLTSILIDGGKAGRNEVLPCRRSTSRRSSPRSRNTGGPRSWAS